MAKSTPDAFSPAPRRGPSLAVLALLGLLLAVSSGAAWWWFVGQQPAQEARAPKPVDPIFVGLEPFTVNLQPNGRSRYLHVAISLKVADDKVQGLLVMHLPEVRSRVLAVLANRDADALLLPAEKERLATEVRAVLEQPFGKHPAAEGISQVMFTTFMLQ